MDSPEILRDGYVMGCFDLCVKGFYLEMLILQTIITGGVYHMSMMHIWLPNLIGMQVFMYVILGTQELETKAELAGLALYLHWSRDLSLCAADIMTTNKMWMAGMPITHAGIALA